MAQILAWVALLATILPTYCVRECENEGTCEAEDSSLLQRSVKSHQNQASEDHVQASDEGSRRRNRRPRGPKPKPQPQPETTVAPTAPPEPQPETTVAPTAPPEPTLSPTSAPAPPPAPEPTLPPAPTPSQQVFPYDFMECPGGAVLTTQQMTFETYDAITSSVSSLLTSLSSECTADSCPQADWAGCVLRMAGHDFMDYSSADGSGGADACTDMTDADNNGLLACLSDGEHGISLKSAYADYCTEVSLADFLVIAAEAVMTVTRSFWAEIEPSAQTIDFRSEFRYGRTTATTCEFAHGRLPNPENGCSAVETTFINNLGLDWTNAAALMGVHTLGRARIENSGYDGWWSDPEHARLFNNNYYIVMYSKGWEVERAINGNRAKNQWTRLDRGARGGSSKEMMLDTDLCLAYDGPDARGGESLKASEMNCCAWAGPVNGIDYDQEGYCGAANIPNGAGAQRRQCCSEPRAVDCGNFRRPGGPAENAVRRFATNDAAWADSFLRAWRTATTNGFTLQRIQN